MRAKQSGRQIFLVAIIFILSLSNSPVLSLQTQDSSSPKDVPMFSIDFFNKASEDMKSSHLDLYVKAVYDKLQFIKNSEDKFSAQYEISISVFDGRGKFVDSEKIKEELIVDSFREANSRTKFNLRKISFDLPPDDYEITVVLKDLETQKKTEIKKSILLKNYSGDEILSSELLFLSKYSIDERGIVNIGPWVSETKISGSNLYAYLEVYNIPENDSLLVQYEVANKDNESFASDEYWTKSTGKRTINVIEIQSKNFPHGQYITKVKFSGKGFSLKVEGIFNWYVEGVPLAFNDIDQAIEVLRYIASEEELKELKNTPPKKKQEAFIKFWKKNDPTPQTVENELRQEYYNRVQFANKHFHRAQKAGWKTDMGWVYVVLGAPDSIDRDPYNSGGGLRPGRTLKAAEMWSYYKYGKQLLFLDYLGFGDYRLNNPGTFYEMIN